MAEASDILNELKDLVADMRSEFCTPANFDLEIDEFLTRLCNSVDERNVVTAHELEEYEAMKAAGEVLIGKELDDAYNEYIENNPEITDEDISDLYEEVEMAESHIKLLDGLQEATDKEVEHVRSGMRQLELKEKQAEMRLIEEMRNCEKLEDRIRRAQEALISHHQGATGLLADDKRSKERTHLTKEAIDDSVFEKFKKADIRFEKNAKMQMELLNKQDDETVIEHLDDIEECYITMMVEHIYMSAQLKAKTECVKKLKEKVKEIENSKQPLNLDEIRDQSLLLEDQLTNKKDEILELWKEELVPAVIDLVGMEIREIKKNKNEYLLNKHTKHYKQLQDLHRRLETGLAYKDLFMLIKTIERQKVIDATELWPLLYQEISEDYSQHLLRMKKMKELKEKHEKDSAIENPLFLCLRKLLSGDGPSINPQDFRTMALKWKNLNEEIEEEEKKRLLAFDRQRIVFFQYEKTLQGALAFVRSGLERKINIQNIEVFTHHCKLEELLDSWQDSIKQIADKFENRKVYFMKNPLQQEKRFLWIYFTTNPKKLVNLVDHLEELREMKFKQMFQKKKPQTLLRK